MKSTILLLAFLTIVSIPALGTPWFNITNAYIQQLDEDSYRLRVFVDWGDIDGAFNSFHLDPLLGTDQRNPTFSCGAGNASTISSPGEWQAGFALYMPFSLCTGSGFGYDFDHTDPIIGPINLSYSATFAWLDYGDQGQYIYPTETFSGTFTADVVPEPTTIFLVGFGLIGAGIVRKLKNR